MQALPPNTVMAPWTRSAQLELQLASTEAWSTAQARRAVLHVEAEPSTFRRLGHCLRRSCRHWHVEGSLGIASQKAIEFFSGDGAHPYPQCMPVKDAKPMRKMPDPAQWSWSLPVKGTLSLSLRLPESLVPPRRL